MMAMFGSTVTTRDGTTGTVLRFPIGTSSYFQTFAGENQIGHLEVIPLLLESGEVRLFTADAFV